MASPWYSAMPHASAGPTPAIERQIVAFIRAGGFPHIAAQAAGVTRRTFERWLRQGRQSDCDPAYRSFASAVMQAAAQARLNAEIATRDSKPLDWLRYGPGKPTIHDAGWTGPVRAIPPKAAGPSSSLEDSTIMAVIKEVQEILNPLPELKERVAAVVNRPRIRQRRREVEP
jgi:hypothetical protein